VLSGASAPEDQSSSDEYASLPSAGPDRPSCRGRMRLVAAVAVVASVLLAASATARLSSSRRANLSLVPRRAELESKAVLEVKAATLPEGRPAAKKPPHIVFLLIDDLGFNDFKDSEDLGPSWPYVKSIAKESVFVNTTYTEAWCSPSRSAFLTGRYHHLLVDNEFSSKDETTIAQRLNSVGYMSYAIGKWHVGWKTWKMTPMGRGFHRYLGNLMNPNDHYTHCSKATHYQSGEFYYDQSYMESYPFVSNSSSPSAPYFDLAEGAFGQYDTQVFDQTAQAFLLQHKDKFPDKPFFLYYAMYADHHPYQAADEWKVNCQDVVSQGRRSLCGMQTSVDSALRNLTTTLKTHFADDNYVVILTGDNGGMVGKGRKVQGWSNNYPLRGMKFTDWEGGVHSRAMVWGKHPDLESSSMKGKTYTGGFMHLVDWHATLAELGGASLDAGPFPASGKSVWRAVLNNEPSPRQSIAVNSGVDGLTYFRRGDWVLVSMTSNASKKAVRPAPPVYPVPVHDYPDTLSNFLKYRAAHPGSKVKIPALFSIWDDLSMEDPLYNGTLTEMQRARAAWFAEAGEKSTNSDADCPNRSCLDERNGAMKDVTAQVAKGLSGPCAKKALYPYWDVPTCSCSLDAS